MNAYEQGFVDKCAEVGVDANALLKRAATQTTLARGSSPYELGMYGEESGENYLPEAVLQGMPGAAAAGAVEGGVIGGVLGHPLSKWLTRNGRDTSKELFKQDLNVVGNIRNRVMIEAGKQGIKSIPSHLWDAFKSTVTGKPLLGEQGEAVAGSMRSIWQNIKGTPEMAALKPVLMRHGKGALIAGAGLAGLNMVGRALLNTAQYQTGKAVTPKKKTSRFQELTAKLIGG